MARIARIHGFRSLWGSRLREALDVVFAHSVAMALSAAEKAALEGFLKSKHPPRCLTDIAVGDGSWIVIILL